MNGIHKYEQVVNGGKFVVLLADPHVENPTNLLTLAVSEVVGRSMFNEFIDITLQRPYLRVVWLGDLNTLPWKSYNGLRDCEYIEFELKDPENKWCGRIVFMRGGLYQSNPNQYMTSMVNNYLKSLDHGKFKTYNEMVERPLDNPWFRVILLNINNLTFVPSINV